MLFLSRKKLKEAGSALRDRELKENFPLEAEQFLHEKEANEAFDVFRRRRMMRRGVTAAAVLVMLILASVTLGPKAYAKIQAWIKGQSGEWTTVKIVSVHPDAAFPTCRLGWRPERFERCISITDEAYKYSEDYRNEYLIDVPIDVWEKVVAGRYDRTDLFPEPGKLWTSPAIKDSSFFGWGYYKLSKYEDSVLYLHRTDSRTGENGVKEEGEWQMGDREVLYHLYNAYGSEKGPDGQTKIYHYDMIDCIWIDQEHDVVFRMTGTLTKEEAQKIIENIVIR